MSETRLDATAGETRRDLLGRVCLLLHFAVMGYIVLGWLSTSRAALVFYMLFLPAVVVQWWINRNSCVLNNLESLLRSGRWRDPSNLEEGAWLLTMVKHTLRLQISPMLLNLLVYVSMLAFWALASAHWQRVF